ncbi:caspase-3-like [Haliotis cracherodii]|uniref:caspase-3-like n=1 Tax=Haliotis cracherodii TaxID=6455 RepID=UPI0039ED1C3F
MAMTDIHKEKLRTNRSSLVDNMADVDHIVNKLFERKTITARMKESILEVKSHTPTDKKWALLDLLSRRGDTAFEEFYNALIECDENIAADILKPGATANTRSSQPIEDDLPESWPPDDHSTCDVTVEMVAKDNVTMRELFEKSGSSKSTIYRIQRSVRGRVLIINNEDFSTARTPLENRTGTDTDATSISLLFDKLSFRTVIKRNLTQTQMMEALEKESKFNHDNYDCFVCVILSHGTRGGVFGVDGEVANLEEIKDMFNGQNCKTLALKPKLFFIQACQGTKRDTGIEGQPDSPVSEISETLKKTGIQDKAHAQEQNQVASTESATKKNHPTRADIFMAEATTPGYMSVRNTKHGTWFIQAIVYIFGKFAHKEDLSSMMTKVNNLVSRAKTQNKGYKQVSTLTSQLLKPFYFFPGLLAEARSFSQVQETV